VWEWCREIAPFAAGQGAYFIARMALFEGLAEPYREICINRGNVFVVR